MQAVKKPVIVEFEFANEDGEVEALGGVVKYTKGDAIMTGVKGEKYPCRRDIFDKTYKIIYRCINCGHLLKELLFIDPDPDTGKPYKVHRRIQHPDGQCYYCGCEHPESQDDYELTEEYQMELKRRNREKLSEVLKK